MGCLGFGFFFIGGGSFLFVYFMKLYDKMGSPVQKALDFSKQDES